MKLKKVLAAALAGTMVMASLTAVSAETMADQSISTFLENMTTGTAEGIAVSGDFDITMTFHNDGNRDKNDYYYTNFSIRIMENTETPDDLYFRADNWSWVYQYDTAITYNADNSVSDGTTIDWYTHTDYDGDWAAWVEAMSAENGGSDCTVNLTRSGNLFTAVMECGGATFTISAEPDFFDADLTVYLTGEQCKLTNIEYTINSASTTSDDTSSDTTEASDDSSSSTTTDDNTSDDTSSTTTTDTTDTTSTTTTTTSDTTTQTGDAAPIAAVAVALIGCAAIAFASKKRFA